MFYYKDGFDIELPMKVDMPLNKGNETKNKGIIILWNNEFFSFIFHIQIFITRLFNYILY